MTFEEKLALNQKMILDPLYCYPFVEPTEWEDVIKSVCLHYVKSEISLHVINSSKCQSYSATYDDRSHIVIDYNHIYLLCRYAATVLQLAYAEKELDEPDKAELKQNVCDELDILLLRYEAIPFVYSNTPGFIPSTLEFCRCMDIIDKRSRFLNEDLLLTGSKSEEYNSDLSVICDMLFMWVVLHEIAHVTYKHDVDFLDKQKDNVRKVLSDVFFKNEEQPQIKQFIEKVIGSDKSLEEIACDDFAINLLMQIFGQKLGDDKISFIFFDVAWTLMDYGQRVFRLMAHVNSELAMFNPEKQTVKQCHESLAKTSLEIQIEFEVRQWYIRWLHQYFDHQLFPTKDDYLPELETRLDPYRSAAKTLFDYSIDYTGSSYLDSFFENYKGKKGFEKYSEEKEQFMRLFQWK
jgi:hypothetical protein